MLAHIHNVTQQTKAHFPTTHSYFTYSLTPDSLRFSETGAAFLDDVMSKHAMHSSGAPEVVYAGEHGAEGGTRV